MPEQAEDLFSYMDAFSQAVDCYDFALKWNVRLPELENVIKDSAEYAYYYAKNVIKGRWPEAEDTIAKAKDEWTIRYVLDSYKAPWLPAEEAVKNMHSYYGHKWAYAYSRYILKSRWVEVEDLVILKQLDTAFLYARDIVQGRWLELEALLLKDYWPGDLIRIKLISSYAKDVIKARWPEAEGVISELLESPQIAEDYIGNTEGRLPENRWKWLKEGPIDEKLVRILNYAKMQKDEQEYIVQYRPDLTSQIDGLDPEIAQKYRHEVGLGQVDL